MFESVAVPVVVEVGNERTAAVQPAPALRSTARSRPAVGVGELRELAGRVAPVTLAADLLLPVGGERVPGLADLLPGRGLRRGSVVGVDGPMGAGVVSLTLALVAAASAAGSWAAFVGFGGRGPDRWAWPVGWVAAAEAGLDLERVAVVPEPGRHWAVVAGAFLDALDLVIIRPPPGRPVRPADARRLTARVRDRAAVLVVTGGGWPEGPDVRLTVSGGHWTGIGEGHGVLTGRHVDVVVTGRGAAARPRAATLRLARAA